MAPNITNDIKTEAAEAVQTIRSLNKESGMIPLETRVCTRTNSVIINPPQSKSMNTVVEFQAYSRPPHDKASSNGVMPSASVKAPNQSIRFSDCLETTRFGNARNKTRKAMIPIGMLT